MAVFKEDLNNVLLQFLDQETRLNYIDYYYLNILQETWDYIEYRKT